MASLLEEFRRKRLGRTLLNPNIRDGTLGADVLPDLLLGETDLEDTFSDGPGPLPIEADNETLGSATLSDMNLEDTYLEGTFWDEPASMQSASMQSAVIAHPSTQSAMMQAPKQYLMRACVHRANLGGRPSCRKSMLKSIADDLKQRIKTHLQKTRGTHGSLFVYKQQQITNVLLDGHEPSNKSMLLGLSDIADVQAVVADEMRLYVEGGVEVSEYDRAAFASFSALHAPHSFERVGV